MPDRPRRALGVVRVSKEREEMVSPDIQWTAIEDHCARRGYQLVGRVEAIDESGSQRRSPWWRKLDQAVSRIEDGEFDVIVVWKFSRAARQRLRWAIAIDRVEAAGGLLESATEPLDVSTSSGRLARGVLAEFNAFEAERIGDVWRDVHARRVRNGLPANGKARFGYEVVDGVHRPDPKTGPVLEALYRRYVAGESAYGLVEWLNREGIRTVPGYSAGGPGAWAQRTLRRVLDSGFGAGFLTVDGQLVRGVHEPVIDARTWELYRAARASRRTARRSERSQYLLSGLVRCYMILESGEPCGSSMGGGQFGNGRTPKFRCIAAHAQRRHAGGYVMMRVVEEEVMQWLTAEADVDRRVGEVAPGTAVRRDADAIAREIAVLEQQLATLSVQLARGVVPEAAYVAARDEIAGERRRLEEQHAAAVMAVSRVDAGPLAAALLGDWEGLTVPERRAILRQLVKLVEVVPGQPRARVKVIPAW